MSITITVDTKDFDKKMKEYQEYTKRTTPEIIATKCYFIARNATMTTEVVPKERIRSELISRSRDYPRASLAAIIVAKSQDRTRYSKTTGKQLKNKAGLYGDKMTAAIEKLIKKRQRATNFLRSGWIPAIKKMATAVKSKSGQPKMDTKSKQYGRDKGGATIPIETSSWKAYGEIWNSVFGSKKKHGASVPKILEDGLNKAIAMEVASMDKYIRGKMDKAAEKFNKNG